jgi:hypothetical protein
MIFQKFEPFELKAKIDSKNEYLWCPIRKKWLIFTPEEWVRQQWIAYFLSQNYPLTWIISEFTILYYSKKIRLDLALVDNSQNIFLLAEFKNRNYSLGMKDLNQILRYAKLLNPQRLLISNFDNSYLWEQENNRWIFLE